MKATMKTIFFPVWVLLVLASCLTMGGCAQQLDEVDRVQNNVTKKADLRGEFYFRSTVIEAPYASMGFFVGNQNYHTERGIFDIQEKTLYFYRTYEHAIGGEVLGSTMDIDTPLYEVDAKGSIKYDQDGKPIPVTYERRIGDKVYTVARYVYKGSPILAFPIKSHFDIKKAYSTTTGEETNVIAEESSDREWWERANMRVNWGGQATGHWDENISPLQGARLDYSFSYFDDEEFADGDKPVWEFDGSGQLEYFDYRVNTVVSAPKSYYGSANFEYIPSCWYYPWYLGQIAECISEKVVFRHSFMRVKPSSYVAWDYDNKMLKKFGYYRIERATYDPLRGVTFSGVSRRIRRHRIWDEYVVNKGAGCETPNGDVYADCPTGSVCEPVGTDGTFCVSEDPNDRLDYTKMNPKAVVFYLSEDFPRNLVPESITLAEHWAVPFDDVVIERKKWSGDTEFQLDHPMFILCENNLSEASAAMAAAGLDINNAADVAKAQEDKLLAGIDGWCKDMASPKRNGDLRYSQLHSINPPTSVGLYGYGPSSVDPMTGEMLSANSYMYTPAMKRGANNAMLLIELLTGIRSFWETLYSNDVKERALKTRLGAAQGGLPAWTVAEAQAAAATMLSPTVREQLEVVGVEKSDLPWASARMARLATQEPGIAKMFVTEDVKLMLRDPAAGLETSEPLSDQLDRMGQHVWGHHAGSWGKQLRYYKDMEQGGCKFLTEFADNAILALGREFATEMNERVCEAAQAAGETIFDFSAFEAVHGSCASQTAGDQSDEGYVCQEVVITEGQPAQKVWTDPCAVGKLKSQVANSIVDLELTNPYNLAEDYYPPDPLYTDTKHQVIQNSQMVLLDTIETVRTEMIERLYKRIYLGVAEHEVGHSIGLRHNFEASTDALNFGQTYWDVKGSFKDGEFKPTDFFTAETEKQAIGGMRPMQSASVMDYSAKFNDRFGGVGYYDRAAVRFGYGGLVEVFNQNPNTKPFDAYMETPSATDTSNITTVPEAHPYLERMFKRIHYTNLPTLWGQTEAMYDRSYVAYSSVGSDSKTDDGLTEVPYRFCSDELAGSLPTCERWDSGVDSYEIVRNMLNDYENYWPIWGYWHDSVLFFPDLYSRRIARVFGAVQMQMQWWVTEYQRFNKDNWWQERFGTPWDQDPRGGLGGAVAVLDSANTFAQAFGRPQPGYHGKRNNIWEPIPWADNALYSDQKLITPLNCDARQLYPAWDYSGYKPVATRAGAIYERLMAFQVLADPSSWFVATDQLNDIKKYLISYYTLFPDELSNLYGSILANKTDQWGWYMVTDDAGKPAHCDRRQIVGPNVDGPEGELGDAWYPFNPEPEYTFPTTRFRLPMLAAYYGLGLFLDSYDSSFVDTTRVYIEGHGQSITPSAEAEVISFSDPLSGKVYSAVRNPNSKRFYPAYHMVEQLRDMLLGDDPEFSSIDDLQEKYNYSDYQFIVDKLELLRAMNYAYDYSE